MNNDTTCPDGQEPLDSVPPPTCDEHPTMRDWAKREVEILLDRERKSADGDPEGFEYVRLCAESAARAYNCLMDDDHSGLSMNITANILIRLLKHLPLTPLTGEDNEWMLCSLKALGEADVFQNRRFGALFKSVFPDGSVKYSQNERIVCRDVNYPHSLFMFGCVEDIVKQYPEIPKITFPYLPSKDPIMVDVEDIVHDEKNGDLDTIAIYNVYWTDDDGGHRELHVNRYFDISEKDPVEISREEWCRRCKLDEEITARRNHEKTRDCLNKIPTTVQTTLAGETTDETKEDI